MTAVKNSSVFHQLLALFTAIVLFSPMVANAVPSFARQTGQNCVACHAGGQFPELTPYGRMFKLTGYTIGERSALPFSMMAVATANKTANDKDQIGGNAASIFPKDGDVIFNTASLFLAGKLTDKMGAFVQVTYNNYDSQSDSDGHWKGHTGSDNLDIRYADRFVEPDSDLIVGATLNNNPTVQDVWNSAPAWGYNTVPGSTGPNQAPLVAGGVAQQAAGLGVYAYWNQTVYAEASMYRTANGALSFMSQGLNADQGSQQILKGYNPYWRLALTHEWGAHYGMIGMFGMDTKIYPDLFDPTGPTNEYRDMGFDAQYQYILDPHTITADVTYMNERIHWATGGPYAVGNQPCGCGTTGVTNAKDSVNLFRAKTSYVYDAKYGGSLSFFDAGGTSNPANIDGAPVSGTQSGSLGSRAWTSELFWTPIQNIRVGLQYTDFSKFNGASNNYDGFGRKASDNNTTFLYLWAAY